MSSAIEDVIREVQMDLMTVDQINLFPEQPPEQIYKWPVCLVYPGPGHWHLGSASGAGGKPMAWAVHTLTIDVYKERVDLAADIAVVTPFASSVPKALIAGYLGDKFGGTVLGLGDVHTPGGTGGTGVVRTEFITPAPGGIDAVGYRFELDVTVEEELTV